MSIVYRLCSYLVIFCCCFLLNLLFFLQHYGFLPYISLTPHYASLLYLLTFDYLLNGIVLYFILLDPFYLLIYIFFAAICFLIPSLLIFHSPHISFSTGSLSGVVCSLLLLYSVTLVARNVYSALIFHLFCVAALFSTRFIPY